LYVNKLVAIFVLNHINLY